jgi:hypothetical protein
VTKKLLLPGTALEVGRRRGLGKGEAWRGGEGSGGVVVSTIEREMAGREESGEGRKRRRELK